MVLPFCGRGLLLNSFYWYADGHHTLWITESRIMGTLCTGWASCTTLGSHQTTTVTCRGQIPQGTSSTALSLQLCTTLYVGSCWLLTRTALISTNKHRPIWRYSQGGLTPLLPTAATAEPDLVLPDPNAWEVQMNAKGGCLTGEPGGSYCVRDHNPDPASYLAPFPPRIAHLLIPFLFFSTLFPHPVSTPCAGD